MEQTITFRLTLEVARNALQAINRAGTEDVDAAHEGQASRYVIDIEGAGEFSDQTFAAMHYLGNLVNTCKQGSQCYSWLMTSIDALLAKRNDDNDEEDTAALRLEKQMYQTWPHEKLVGFGFNLERSYVYCAREQTWFNDLIIETFMKTLCEKYGNNKTILLPPILLPDKGNKENVYHREFGTLWRQQQKTLPSCQSI